MPFTGNEDHSISLADASILTESFRESIPAGATDQTIGHFFGKTAIQNILNQENCVGIRVYYALDADQNRDLVITGVKANKDDLEQGLLAEHALRCPPNGGANNSLNS